MSVIETSLKITITGTLKIKFQQYISLMQTILSYFCNNFLSEKLQNGTEIIAKYILRKPLFAMHQEPYYSNVSTVSYEEVNVSQKVMRVKLILLAFILRQQ